MTDTTAFFNKYVQVLKSKFDSAMNENIQLETQLILAREEMEKLNGKVAELEMKLEKELNKNTAKTTRRNTKEDE